MKGFVGKNNQVRSVIVQKARCASLRCNAVNATQRIGKKRGKDNDSRSTHEVAGTEYEIKADLVLIAAGFLQVECSPLVNHLSLAADNEGNLLVDSKGMTSIEGIFATGDCVSCVSTVVDALYHGRRIAESVDIYQRRKSLQLK